MKELEEKIKLLEKIIELQDRLLAAHNYPNIVNIPYVQPYPSSDPFPPWTVTYSGEA